MSDNPVVQALCQLPADQRRTGASTLTTLENSGYLANSGAISEEVIEEHLRCHPELIELWLLESGDQRSPEGWYLLSPDESQSRRWVVGYYPKGILCELDDKFRACAIFVKRYADLMAGFCRDRRK